MEFRTMNNPWGSNNNSQGEKQIRDELERRLALLNQRAKDAGIDLDPSENMYIGTSADQEQVLRTEVNSLATDMDRAGLELSEVLNDIDSGNTYNNGDAPISTSYDIANQDTDSPEPPDLGPGIEIIPGDWHVPDAW